MQAKLEFLSHEKLAATVLAAVTACLAGSALCRRKVRLRESMTDWLKSFVLNVETNYRCLEEIAQSAESNLTMAAISCT